MFVRFSQASQHRVEPQLECQAGSSGSHTSIFLVVHCQCDQIDTIGGLLIVSVSNWHLECDRFSNADKKERENGNSQRSAEHLLRSGFKHDSTVFQKATHK
jgi:hypothetical protein